MSSSMMILVVLLVAVLAFASGTKSKGNKGDSQKGGGKYVPKAILTANEQEFFNRLKSALPFQVFPQVAMGALMEPVGDRNSKEFWSARGSIAQKIVDFVVVDDQFKVLALVELDDRTHSQTKDGKRDELTAQAGYRTLRYSSKAKPSLEQLRQDFGVAAPQASAA